MTPTQTQVPVPGTVTSPGDLSHQWQGARITGGQPGSPTHGQVTAIGALAKRALRAQARYLNENLARRSAAWRNRN